MSSYFLFNNLHFAVELLGALAFLVAAWLAFDAFVVRRDFLTASRGIGFLLLAGWHLMHALALPSDVAGYIAYALYLFGISFLLLNLILEAPVSRPTFQAVIILPAFLSIVHFFQGATAAGMLLIAAFAFRQYRREFKKTLRPFWIGFTFLGIGAAVVFFSPTGEFNPFWIIGHVFELFGFIAIGWWIWKYLELRIREEMLLIFISLSMLMAIAVSLSFSSILTVRIEAQTRVNLATDVRVLDLAIERFREEALAKTRLLAAAPELDAAVSAHDFVALEQFANDRLANEKLGFLSILDEEGNILVRAHALVQKDENLSSERAVQESLMARSFVTVATNDVEGLSIRAAAPFPPTSAPPAGIVVAGFPLDNAFADSMKRITGLEMSLFAGEILAATTMFEPGGQFRGTGTKLTDERVYATVLSQGQPITLRTTILSRPHIASYLPLKDADGTIVGMLSAARPQQAILETANATNRLTLFVVAVIALVLIVPIYLITRRLSREVT